MPNMSLVKNVMPEQEANLRNKDFSEVSLGYSKEAAIDEAERCLHCKNSPCVSGCPVNVNIPKFINSISLGNFEEAYSIITYTNSLPAICGRVCPQENQCEGKCVRGIKGEPVGIGRLERFVADNHIKNCNLDGSNCYQATKSNGHRVAVVGSGPSGLTCAGNLARKGYEVTIFESFHKAGGVLIYGIPEFRLPKKIVQAEVENLITLGVKIETNAIIGRSMSVDELFEDGFEAVFLGTGAGLPQFMNIPGENLLGVYSANEYLTRINLMKAYLPEYDTPIKKAKHVAVVGGGNVAIDAARCAKRLGAEEVYIVYRRSMNELPARKEEVHHAIEEEIRFKLQNNPIAVLGDKNGFVKGIECVEMKLCEPDESGRRRPIEIKGSNHIIEVDAVIMAIGTSPNPLLRSTTEGLEADRKGCLITDDNTATTRKGIFAGGDAVTGAATVISAMGAGKKAAESIDKYIMSR